MAEQHRQDWMTPKPLFERIAEAFGGFDIDAAASSENSLCEKFFSAEENALNQTWSGKVWCNPPYNNIEAWLEKATTEAVFNVTTVFILPPRTDSGWFHRYALSTHAEIAWIRGRVAFVDPTGNMRSGPQGPSFLLGFGPERQKLRQLCGLNAADFKDSR